jgi:ribonucleoside-diphosphate reductase alpha chain
VPRTCWTAARAWDEAVALASEHGYRNAQISVLAPTGTIAFMMDCDTTGVEPDIALVKYKKLVGGGMLKIVNKTVPARAARLGYDAEQIKAIVEYIDENDTIEGAPDLADEHLPVFDCAFKPANGTRRSTTWATADDGGRAAVHLRRDLQDHQHARQRHRRGDRDAYLEAWKLGLKAVAIYRDGCKRSQPLNPAADEKKESRALRAPRAVRRRKLPDERRAITHKFSWRPRGLHHRRDVRGRDARRDLHPPWPRKARPSPG